MLRTLGTVLLVAWILVGPLTLSAHSITAFQISSATFTLASSERGRVLESFGPGLPTNAPDSQVFLIVRVAGVDQSTWTRMIDRIKPQDIRLESGKNRHMAISVAILNTATKDYPIVFLVPESVQDFSFHFGDEFVRSLKVTGGIKPTVSAK